MIRHFISANTLSEVINGESWLDFPTEKQAKELYKGGKGTIDLIIGQT